MNHLADDLQQSIATTRQEITDTRAALTEKLELLEERVRETVEGATSTVDEIIEQVKGTVDDTVTTVKETVGGAQATVENITDTMDETIARVKRSFDLTYQVEQRPWLMLGASVALGYLVGGLRGWRAASVPARDTPAFAAAATYGSAYYSLPDHPPAQAEPVFRSQPQKPGMWSYIRGQVQEELDLLTSAAIRALGSSLRETARHSLHNLAPQRQQVRTNTAPKVSDQPTETKTSVDERRIQ